MKLSRLALLSLFTLALRFGPDGVVTVTPPTACMTAITAGIRASSLPSGDGHQSAVCGRRLRRAIVERVWPKSAQSAG